MSLGGGQTQSPVADSNKYAQIMELMRLKQAMSPMSTYTGGFNSASPSSNVSAAPSSYYDELMRQQALISANQGRGGSGTRDSGFRSESPMAGPGPSTLLGNLTLAADSYGNALGGLLPGAFFANLASQFVNPYAAINESQANQNRLASLVAADPSYGGGGYGTPTSLGGFGVTSPTGAGIAANPMGNDPATAQGQQSYGGGFASGDGGGNSGGGDSGGGDSGGSAAGSSARGGGGFGGTGSGIGGGDGGGGGMQGNSGGNFGGGFGGGDGGGGDGGGGFYKGGQVTMDRLQGPNPMGPDDGYAGLKDGEFVINAKSVGKYGIELMNAINAGKISKGKLRGLLEA